MKIKGYTKIYDKNSIAVYEKVSTDIPLRWIVKYNLRSDEILCSDSIMYRDMVKEKRYKNSYMYSDSSWRFKCSKNSMNSLNAPIPLKTDKGIKSIDGIIAYNKVEQLVEFLMNEIDMQKETVLTLFIKKCTNYKGKIDKSILFKELTHLINEEAYMSNFFIEYRKIEKENYFNYVLDNKNYLIGEENGCNKHFIFSVEKTKEVKGYKIPYLDYIYYMEVSDQGRYDNGGISYINGKIKVFNNLTMLNNCLMSEFDNKGQCYDGTMIDLLPDNSKEVIAVIKVPTQKEYRKLKKQSKDLAHNAILDKPFYIEPSYKAAFIPDDVEIIEDVSVFEHIVTRMAGGIYIPDNTHFQFKEEILGSKNEYLLLMKPV
ncbi:MAG: hypothetical protein KA120_05880 [Candidatus Goldbacteria bacterium]|nr:hypothetical protein [Candidatus Goldiibacteriota bacterium]